MDEESYLWSPWRASSYGLGLRSHICPMFESQDGTRESKGIIACTLAADETTETLLGAISVYMVRNHPFSPSRRQLDEPLLKLHFGVQDGEAMCASYVAGSYHILPCVIDRRNHSTIKWEYATGVMTDHLRMHMLDQLFIQRHRIAMNFEITLRMLLEDATEQTRRKGREKMGGISN